MKITLEQWQTLVTVVEAGSYARAAELMNKSQSAISYSMSKMEDRLGLAIFRLEGRRAVLTTAGEALFNQAKTLLEKARYVEGLAGNYQAGSQSTIHLAMEIIFPVRILSKVLQAYAEKYPFIRVELHETALSGTSEALKKDKVELAIIANESARFMGDFLMPVKFVTVAHPQHPLHQLQRPLSYDDLVGERQIVIRDSGSQPQDAGWLEAQQRWTVSTMATSLHCTTSGLGFAWYPQVNIQHALDAGQLKPLPLEQGAERQVDVYMVMRDGKSAAPHVQYLAALIRDAVNSACQRHHKAQAI